MVVNRKKATMPSETKNNGIFAGFHAIPKIDEEGEYTVRVKNLVENENGYLVILTPFEKQKNGVEKVYADVMLKIDYNFLSGSAAEQFINLYSEVTDVKQLKGEKLCVEVSLNKGFVNVDSIEEFTEADTDKKSEIKSLRKRDIPALRKTATVKSEEADEEDSSDDIDAEDDIDEEDEEDEDAVDEEE